MKPRKHINAEIQELQEMKRAWAVMQEEFNKQKIEAIRKEAYEKGQADSTAKFKEGLKWVVSSVIAPITVALLTVWATKFF